MSWRKMKEEALIAGIFMKIILMLMLVLLMLMLMVRPLKSNRGVARSARTSRSSTRVRQVRRGDCSRWTRMARSSAHGSPLTDFLARAGHGNY